MIQEFINKLNNNEYISKYLFEYVQNNSSSSIPTDFNIDNYNNIILDRLYKENKDYFDHMYDDVDPNIHLDEEQCKAILADEKYSLIIAGAGTGKTTTMTAKVKYLVDKKNAIPERILVMSYTRKATEELAKRIEADFNIPVHVTTFHSLGYEYIKDEFKLKKCIIVDNNKKRQIALDYFRSVFIDKEKLAEVIDAFGMVLDNLESPFDSFFLLNYEKYNTYDDMLEAYTNYKIEEAKNYGIEKRVKEWVERQLLKDDHITSIKGDIVKSAGEMIISNYLYMHGLDYYYEEVYDEIMEYGSIYKPDFTIDYGGAKIYIEYFGMNNEHYNKIKEKKEKMHIEKHNKFIEIEKMPLERIEEILDLKLKEFGVVYKERTYEDAYKTILNHYPLYLVNGFMSKLDECIIARKESLYRDDTSLIINYLNTLNDKERKNTEIQNKYITEYYNFYSNELYGRNNYYFDFSDLLYYSAKYIEYLTTDHYLFDYIIIDEYQDISQKKYELTYKTANRNNANVYAVGDDWQSIYGFSGSRIEYIYKFDEFFKGAKDFRISKTYRNSQELIDISGEFIMRNEDQLKKQLISDKHLERPIVLKVFDGRLGRDEEINCLKRTILEIHKEHPEHKILVLARTNRMIRRCLEDSDLIDGVESKVIFKKHDDIIIDAMTIHKSKGLTYDEVVIVGLNNYFPIDKINTFWYLYLYKNRTFTESIPFAEERRLFYVALTRTKNRVYLLCNENSRYRSSFVDEIAQIMSK